jgi:glycine cleavage system H protein
MKTPENLKYTKNDEWIRVEGNVGIVGITDYAQTQLKDILYLGFDLEVDEEAAVDDAFATIDSVKDSVEIYMPVSGTLIELHESLSDELDLFKSDPYGEAWMAKIELSDPAELDELMDAAAYLKYCEER